MRIEWLILADGAEVVGNKLYLLGGGWDRLTLPRGLPARQHCAVAASVLVPWQAVGRTHEFAMDVYDPSGRCMAGIEAEFEVGQAPGVDPGRVQRWQFAGDFELLLEGPGRHVVLARINGGEPYRQEFEVVSGFRA